MADEHDTPAAETVAPPPAAPAPGAALREARSNKSLSLDELVVQTKLPLSVLQAMEADDFRTLNEPVYVRGYYRKYARALGLEEAPILAGYEAHGGAVTRKPEVSLLVPEDPRPSARWPILIGVVVLLAGIAAAANWYLSRDDAATESTVAPAASLSDRERGTNKQAGTATRPPATATRQAEPVVAEPEPEQVTAAEATPQLSSAPQQTADEPEPATQAASTAAAGEPDNLVLDFGDDSWVRVEDDTGQRLLNGLVQGGQSRQLEGVPPYTVFLGYAPGVSVSYQGQDVAVAPHTRGNNTARFTVE